MVARQRWRVVIAVTAGLLLVVGVAVLTATAREDSYDRAQQTPSLDIEALQLYAPYSRVCMAHMVNSVAAVQWAVSQGANGLEIDVNFDKRTNQATFAHHGGVNDCSFKIRDLFGNRPPICNLHPSPGKVSTPIVPMLQGIRYYAKDVALLFIDSKQDKHQSIAASIAQGKSIGKLLVTQLLQKGWKGNLIIGEAVSYSEMGKAYLDTVAAVLRANNFEGRAAFAFDYEAQKLQRGRAAHCPSGYTNMGVNCFRAFPPSSKGTDSMTCKKHEIKRGFQCYYNPPLRVQPNIPYRDFSGGISAMLPLKFNYNPALSAWHQGECNACSGFESLDLCLGYDSSPPVAWSYDNKKKIRDLLRSGVVVMTNNPAKCVNIATKSGYHLAKGDGGKFAVSRTQHMSHTPKSKKHHGHHSQYREAKLKQTKNLRYKPGRSY